MHSRKLIRLCSLAIQGPESRVQWNLGILCTGYKYTLETIMTYNVHLIIDYIHLYFLSTYLSVIII